MARQLSIEELEILCGAGVKDLPLPTLNKLRLDIAKGLPKTTLEEFQELVYSGKPVPLPLFNEVGKVLLRLSTNNNHLENLLKQPGPLATLMANSGAIPMHPALDPKQNPATPTPTSTTPTPFSTTPSPFKKY
jgi:hypothetical protein